MRLERLENESALTRLVYNYCHGIDRRDLERFLNIWNVDAIWDAGAPLGRCTGIAEIQKGLSEGVWPAFRASQHWTTNLVFEIDGDKARGLSNVVRRATQAARGSSHVMPSPSAVALGSA